MGLWGKEGRRMKDEGRGTRYEVRGTSCGVRGTRYETVLTRLFWKNMLRKWEWMMWIYESLLALH